MAGLRADVDRIFRGKAEHLLDFHGDPVRVGSGQIDLVHHRDEFKVVLDREVGVRHGLGLDALGRVDHQDRAFARRECPTDFVGEVDVSRGIDEVEFVGLPLELVHHRHCGTLDGDAAFAFQIHRVEHLGSARSLVDSAGGVEESIGKRALAVIDVGDDREIPNLQRRIPF